MNRLECSGEQLPEGLNSASLPSLSRRRFLAGAGTGGALALLGALFPGAGLVAQGTEADPGLSRFINLSTQLTGRDTLDETLAGRIYESFLRFDDSFGSRVQALGAFLETSGNIAIATLPTVLEERQPELADLPLQIVTAWYMGEVKYQPPEELPQEDRSSKEPVEPRTEVVAYADTLMFDPVEDVLNVPSFCAGAPGVWAEAPA